MCMKSLWNLHWDWPYKLMLKWIRSQVIPISFASLMKPCQTAYYPPIETASSMSTCLIENKTKKKCVYSNVPDNMYLTLAIKNQVSVNHDLIIKDSFGFKILVPFCAGLQDLSTRSAVQPVRSVSRCRLNSLQRQHCHAACGRRAHGSAAGNAGPGQVNKTTSQSQISTINRTRRI